MQYSFPHELVNIDNEEPLRSGVFGLLLPYCSPGSIGERKRSISPVEGMANPGGAKTADKGEWNQYQEKVDSIFLCKQIRYLTTPQQ